METVENRERFKDKNFTLWSFADRILIVCPKCDGKAEVTGKGMFGSAAELKCSSCFYKERLGKKKFDLRVNRNCDSCGEKIEILIANTNEKKEKIKIKCPHCGQTREHKPSYGDPEDYITMTIGIPRDPYFGYSLWLQENFKSFIFWAYNYEHLDYLDSYIKSKLRERNNRTGWTLVEKLPSFIKEAKNRAKLGIIVGRLRRK